MGLSAANIVHHSVTGDPAIAFGPIGYPDTSFALEAGMDIQRINDLAAPDGSSIPAILIRPDLPRSGAVLLHPYGTSKEHMLGLAFAVAEQGGASIAIDNCGHGENMAAIGPRMLSEVDAAIAYMRQRFGRVGCAGLSLGGRLSLMSSADYMVAMSPAVVTEISPQGKWMFENFPKPGVREPYSGYVAQLLKELGPVPAHDRPCMLLYAERDIPMILNGSKELTQLLPQAEVRIIGADIRPDIEHDVPLIRYLPRWFNHEELKLNMAAIAVTSQWLARQQASVAGA
jgi:dienelactone hydrolase